MSWTGDMRPGSGSSAGQPGMGNDAEDLFNQHPLGLTGTLLIVGVVLIAFGLHIGGGGGLLAAIGVIIALAGLICLPFAIRASRRKARAEGEGV
jgi:hypothetical protein